MHLLRFILHYHDVMIIHEIIYRLVGRDVRAAGGVSIDTAQPVGGVTLRLRLRIMIIIMACRLPRGSGR